MSNLDKLVFDGLRSLRPGYFEATTLTELWAAVLRDSGLGVTAEQLATVLKRHGIEPQQRGRPDSYFWILTVS